MILAVDIGNTHTSVALFEHDELAHHWTLATVLHRTADEYLVTFDRLLALEPVLEQPAPRLGDRRRIAEVVLVQGLGEARVDGLDDVLEHGDCLGLRVPFARGKETRGATVPRRGRGRDRARLTPPASPPTACQLPFDGVKVRA